MMSEGLATIAVVPRERFSFTREALERLYAVTTPPFRLVYVDGGSPRHIREYLATQAQKYGFDLVRTGHYLSPNEARNLAARLVGTKYVVFIDNDVLVTPGWLDALVACAEETGAWVVGPLYCIGPPELHTVHMAGGTCHVLEEAGRRRLMDRHRLVGKRWGDIRSSVTRESVELMEFHCMLVRMEAFERVGPLDEALLSVHEHLDLCMTILQAGGPIYFEPAAVVTWMAPPPLAWSDLPFFLRRWSELWNRASLEYFDHKWALNEDDRRLVQLEWLTDYRQAVLRLPVSTERLRRLLGWRLGGWAGRRVVIPVEQALTRLLAPWRRLPRPGARAHLVPRGDSGTQR
jgi:glycosyltransferase involved in cell wall biosynthesis